MRDEAGQVEQVKDRSGIVQLKVPDAVFGTADASSNMGALERMKKAKEARASN